MWGDNVLKDPVPGDLDLTLLQVRVDYPYVIG